MKSILKKWFTTEISTELARFTSNRMLDTEHDRSMLLFFSSARQR